MTAPIPHDAETERALLGALLLNPEAIRTLRLLPMDFYIVRNRYVFEAMLAIAARKETVDYLVLVKALEQTGQLGEVGGAGYITSLVT